MPALDACHSQVVHALEKAGWTVAPKPFVLRLDRIHSVHIDIEAINAQQSIMVVEVKCFQDANIQLGDLYTAIGQYLIYRSLLQQKGIVRSLYLAVPVEAYYGIFQRIAMPIIRSNQIKVIVVDMGREVVESWLE